MPRSGAMPTARGGLFRKYVVLFVAVVSLALAINGASDIWFSYQEQQALLFQIQRGQAKSAAEKIGQFLNEIMAGLTWETQLSWSDGTLDEWQFDAVRLLHQVPALTEIVQLDAAGREQFRMSREAPDVIESRIDHSKETAFIEAMAHKVYYGPVYFIDEIATLHDHRHGRRSAGIWRHHRASKSHFYLGCRFANSGRQARPGLCGRRRGASDRASRYQRGAAQDRHVAIRAGAGRAVDAVERLAGRASARCRHQRPACFKRLCRGDAARMACFRRTANR